MVKAVVAELVTGLAWWEVVEEESAVIVTVVEAEIDAMVVLALVLCVLGTELYKIERVWCGIMSNSFELSKQPR